MTLKKRNLIQVVAQLQPKRCGVSDYAIAVAQDLASAFCVDTSFAIVNSEKRCELPFPRIHSTQAKLLEACDSLRFGEQGTLLVHLSGYGFSRDGAAQELANSLAGVKATGRFRIAIYFHELYAPAMPWRSAFWYQKRQKRVAAQMAGLCDVLFTNTEFHAGWLEREAGRKAPFSIQILPVCSNIGEASHITQASARRPTMMIFGMPGTRKMAYEQLSSLGKMLRKLEVEELLDVGPEFQAPEQVNGIPVKKFGLLPAPDLRLLLQETRFGFVKYPPLYLAKSGVLAGLCAMGTVPVVAKSFDCVVDGLQDGVHLLSPRTARMSMPGGIESCSNAAWQWYMKHCVHEHATAYSRLFD